MRKFEKAYRRTGAITPPHNTGLLMHLDRRYLGVKVCPGRSSAAAGLGCSPEPWTRHFARAADFHLRAPASTFQRATRRGQGDPAVVRSVTCRLRTSSGGRRRCAQVSACRNSCSTGAYGSPAAATVTRAGLLERAQMGRCLDDCDGDRHFRRTELQSPERAPGLSSFAWRRNRAGNAVGWPSPRAAQRLQCRYEDRAATLRGWRWPMYSTRGAKPGSRVEARTCGFDGSPSVLATEPCRLCPGSAASLGDLRISTVELRECTEFRAAQLTRVVQSGSIIRLRRCRYLDARAMIVSARSRCGAHDARLLDP